MVRLLSDLITFAILMLLIWLGLYVALPDLDAPWLWAMGGAAFLARTASGGNDGGGGAGWEASGDGDGDGGD